MNDIPKSMALLAQVARSLLAHSSKAAATHLGDRRLYIGMSDIGRGVDCLRAAVANKLDGSPQPQSSEVIRWLEDKQFDEIQSVLRKQITLQRGHWFEAGVVEAFQTGGARLFSQLEIETESEGVPIKAHLDLVLAWDKPRPAIRILELKSTESFPESLYSSYEMQLYGQLGFLATCWNQPCFSLRDGAGQILFRNLTLPEIARKHLGLDLPTDPGQVDIEGWVLALSMTSAKAFGPYNPDDSMLAICRKTATAIWSQAEAVRNGKTTLDLLDHCEGFHPLCDWCAHANTCPKFATVNATDPSLDQMLDELDDLKRQKAEIEEGIGQREQQVSDFYRRSRLKGEWIGTGGHRFRCSSVEGRKSLDQAALSAAIVSRLGESEALQLLAKCSKQGAPYQRLSISKITTTA